MKSNTSVFFLHEMLALRNVLAINRKALLRPSFRALSTVKVSSADGESILVAQRKNRPVSPHLQIYQPQLTAILSGLHRISGVALSVGVYGVGAAFGFGLVDSASLIDFYTQLPAIAKWSLKTLAALPFSFHAWNGIRHLIWDAGYLVNITGVYKTGYTVLGLTAITSLALLLL